MPEAASRDALRRLPSVDRVLGSAALQPLIEAAGPRLVRDHVRAILAESRNNLASAARPAGAPSVATIAAEAAARLAARDRSRLRRVFNLTGTVLHTNLGRAPLPEAAITAMTEAARHASSLEYDLAQGRRGRRETHVERLLCELTGAEAATVVNNNAAAVLVLLNTLARGREVLVSRGELIEIGGAFRLPDIMRRAGARLVEVGTTNRTREADFAEALGSRTAMLLKAHPSNFAISGFTEAVAERRLAALARRHAVPFAIDLGSGALVDLAAYGLPSEPTVQATLAAGADLVTFSGDKLLGGPQAGLIVGRRELVARIERNPLKRCLRLDKVTLAALGAVLELYRKPADLARALPGLSLLTRPPEAIRAAAERLVPMLAARLAPAYAVRPVALASEIGSGAQPTRTLASAGIACRPARTRGAGRALDRLAAGLRALRVPVIGRIAEGDLLLDLRCLDDEALFAQQLDELVLAA